MSKVELQIPFLSVRDFVLFPMQRRAIFIGRSFSIQSVKESLASYNGDIVIASQKLTEMNDKPDPDSIFEVGCLCKILEMTALEDDSIKIIVEAKSRFQIVNIQDEKGARYCTDIEIRNFAINSLNRDVKASLTSRIKEVLPHAVESLAVTVGEQEFIACAALAVSSVASIKKVPPGGFLVDSLSPEEAKQINLRLARFQEILAEENVDRMAEKLLNLIP